MIGTGPLVPVATCLFLCAAAGARDGLAACNAIPSAERTFVSRLGSIDQPFAEPGRPVAIHRDTAVFAQDPAGNRVSVRFVPPAGPITTIEDVTVLPPADGTPCAPSQCGAGRCPCIRVLFPDTDGLVGGPGDGRTLTGPVEIRIRTGRDTTAVIDRLSTSPVAGTIFPDPVFPAFVALPPANVFDDLLASGHDVLAATDGHGNLFVPFAFGDVASPNGAQTRFVEARLAALVGGASAIDSFTAVGQRLPPLMRRTADDTLLGTVDAPASVLRVAGGLARLGGPPRGAEPIVVPGVAGFADPSHRADPLTLLAGRDFAVFERRECDRPGECTDLNGDGDVRDYFLMGLDLRAPGAEGFPIDEVDGSEFPGFDENAPPFSLYAFTASDAIATFTIAEPFSIDLNADGDRFDLVRSGAFDLMRRERIVAADGAPRLEVHGSVLAFSVPVVPDAPIDALAVYVADGFDPGPHLVADGETPLFLVTRTDAHGPNVSVPFDFAVRDGRVAFVVPEALQGTDLTGDGDAQDFALLLYDAGTDVVTNLRRAGTRSVDLSSGLVAFNVARPDGTTAVELVVPEAPELSIRICNVAGASGLLLPGASDLLVPCVVREAAVDLNGDGDRDDFVLRVLTSAAPPGGLVEFDLRLAMASLFDVQSRNATMVVGVSEALQHADLNGDGRIEPALGPFGPFVLITFHAPTARLDTLGVDAIQTFPPAARFVDGGFEILQATTDPAGVPGTRRVFLRDLDDDGRFEDLGLREGGRLVPFDNCPLDSNPRQEDIDADGAGDACDPLQPGRRTRLHACLVEFAVGGPAGRTGTRSCRDGQPGCDFDDVPGQCTFHVNACLLVPDERLPECTARRPRLVHLEASVTARDLGPRFVAADATARLRASLGDLGATLVAERLTFEPPLVPGDAAYCTEVMALAVPLSRVGRPARHKLELVTHTAGGGEDAIVDGRHRAAVALRCLPAR